MNYGEPGLPDDGPESPNRVTWLVLSYAWIAVCCVGLPVIPLVMEREDEFAKWHAKHGLVLGLVWLGLSIVLLGLANLVGMASDVGKGVFYLLWGLVAIPYLGLCIVALMKGLQGERWTLKPLEGILSKLSF